MQDSLVVLALTGAIFVAAGVVKGVLGMGLPTVAIGFLGLVIAPVEAAAMLVLPSLITNVWQLIAGPNFRALSKRFGTLLLGICLGTPFGVSFITSGNTQIVTAGLGVVLTIYGAFGLSAAQLTVAPKSEWWLSPFMGFCTGVLMGATGISALPVAPYFTALNLKKDDLIQRLCNRVEKPECHSVNSCGRGRRRPRPGNRWPRRTSWRIRLIIRACL